MQKTCELSYIQTFNIGMVLGVGKQVFSCNGMYDPDITGIGFQPLYFNQLSELYNHYTVSKSTMEFQPMGSTVPRDMYMSLYIDDDATLGGTTAAGSRPGAKTKAFNNAVTTCPPISVSWDSKKYFGNTAINNSLFRGDGGSNPAEQSYFVIEMHDTSLANYSLVCRVKVTYTATWSELKTIASS